jgi:hypothetical protein
MAQNRVSYPVASGNTIIKGAAVAINNSGELFLADNAALTIGVAFEAGIEGMLVSVVTEGEFYCNASGAIPAGVRVQPDGVGLGEVEDATGLTGRMLGIAAADAVGGQVLVSVRPFDVDVVAP